MDVLLRAANTDDRTPALGTGSRIALMCLLHFFEVECRRHRGAQGGRCRPLSKRAYWYLSLLVGGTPELADREVEFVVTLA
jgi:hypothetical protein